MDAVALKGVSIELVPMKEQHLTGLIEAGKPNEIWTYMATKVVNQDDMYKMLNGALIGRKMGVQMPFTVITKNDAKVVGSTRYLDISKQNKTVEIGWTWYHPSVWRTRVNTECKYLLLQYAFEELEMNRVQFKTDSRNIRSQKAIARLGAQKEGVLRKDRIVSDGYVRDTVVFSIVKEEWPEIKVKLKQYLTL